MTLLTEGEKAKWGAHIFIHVMWRQEILYRVRGRRNRTQRTLGNTVIKVTKGRIKHNAMIIQAGREEGKHTSR